jgi:type III secretory pathway component EscU
MSAALLAHEAVAGYPLPVTQCFVNKPFRFCLLQLARVYLLLFVLLVFPLLQEGILQV